MSILISAKDIQKTYKVSAGYVPALKGVSCDFEENRFYVIVGRSGSGKSTICTNLILEQTIAIEFQIFVFRHNNS